MALGELSGGTNTSEHKSFEDLEQISDSTPSEMAAEVRSYLGINLITQSRWHNVDEALKTWRKVVQEFGVYIFKWSFNQRTVSGFSLHHEECPLIYLNNSNAFTRQIFTIFHELAHILYHTSGVAKVDDRYIDELEGTSRRIEMSCNEFAAELLVPSEDFTRWEDRVLFDDVFFDLASQNYQVSREVILRKLRDHGRVGQEFYDSKISQWTNDFQNGRDGGGEGNYYNNQVAYFGDKFLSLAFGSLHQGRCTAEQLSEYMNVKVRNLPALEEAFLGRSSS